ncbi:hypothetical protein HON15_04530, partial [Candidatus Woesearchaeota archaeon]|nr:hypothetical protein [Candidatus Woesearchaeota archaeon]
KSVNKKDLGNYFGTFNENVGHNVVQDYLGIFSSTDVIVNRRHMHIDAEYIFHDSQSNGYTVDTDELYVKSTFKPDQEVFGLRLDYHQTLDKLVKGLFFKVNLPIVHMKNDMGAVYTTTYGGVTDRLTQPVIGYSAEKGLSDYLSGNFTNTAQDELTAAKIDGSQSKIGFADIEIALGYTLFHEADKKCSGHVQVTIPTSNKPSGEYLFEPVLGNGRHFAVGLGLDGEFEIWKDEDKSLDFIFAAEWKHLFKDSETRTLGITTTWRHDTTRLDDNGLYISSPLSYGHYYLAGQVGSSKLFPLANVLTRDVEVRPGMQIDLLLQMAFNWGNFKFDAGYEFFAKEKEDVSLLSWDDDTYGIALTTFNAGTDTFDTAYALFQTLFDESQISTNVTESPAQSSHKVFGSFGYSFVDWKYPMMLGLGGSYEFLPGRNVGLEGYAFWLKAGIIF